MGVKKTATKSGARRWRVVWRGPDGRQHEKWFTRRVDADTFHATVTLARGRHDPVGARRTVSAAVDEWLAGAAPRLAPKTVESYRSLGRMVSKALGGRRVDAVTTAELQRVVAGWQRAGLSPSRVRQAVRLLGQVLGQAVHDGALARNPVAGVRLPPMPSSRTQGFTPEEADRLVAAMPERWWLLGDVLSHLGLRWAEAAGLTVGQLDFTRRRVTVDRSTSQVNGKLHDRTTKSGRSRVVPIPAELAHRLQEATEGLSRDARVFTGPGGGPLRYDNWRRRVWLPALDATGLTGGVHGLRKAAATRWLRAGVAPHVVARIMGHTDVQVTLRIYSEVVDMDLDRAAELVDANLN